MAGSLLCVLLFDRFGKFDLARPAVYSALVFGFVLAAKWKLKKYPWFWITIVFVAALHVVVILTIPWTTRWIPALVLIPIGYADLYASSCWSKL